MCIEQILQQRMAISNTTYNATQAGSQNEYKSQEGLNISDLTIALSPVGFVILWAFFLLILQKIRSNLDNKIAFNINGIHSVPCKNCKFFANNHYLKCAVKPDIVLTEEAINCPEYCPKKSSFPPNKLFR